MRSSRHVTTAGRSRAAARSGWSAGITAHLGLLALGASALQAQEDTTKTDSLRFHRLSEIVIEAAAPEEQRTHTTARINAMAIRARDARSVAEIGRLVPAAFIQTNSRGESLVFLRNAGERQVAVFLDGALLNIPWDNRVDLGLVPAQVIDGMTVAKGVPPVEYGANVMGGAVNLTTHAPETPLETRGSAAFGSGDRRGGWLLHHGRLGELRYEASVGHSETDGWPLPDDPGLPFNQTDPDLRTNTDSRITNVFARGVIPVSRESDVGLSVLVVDAEKGIAPEGHLDPAEARVRFWRYPTWRYVTAILSGEGMLGWSTHWKASAWISDFTQNIVSFESAAFDTPESREEDDDLTIGGRGVFQHQLGASVLKFAVNALTSLHQQRDLALDAAGQPVGGPFPELDFRQHLVSVGAEYTFEPWYDVSITAGAGIDAMFAAETGDKPGIDPFVDYSLTLGLRKELGDHWFIRAAAGRKTRFPTMRELFGEALDRFLLNPDLNPESAFLTEAGVGWRGSQFSGEIIPFLNITSNTIDRRNVQVVGETRPRRQRVNLDDSYVLGVELVGTARPVRRLDVNGHLTLMRPRRRGADPGEPDLLAEKPEALGRLTVTYHVPLGLRVMVEGEYTGRAYSPDEQNDFVALPTSFVVNARLGQQLMLGPAQAELFVRGDNLADERVVPQLGLPGPGRSLSGGVDVTF